MFESHYWKESLSRTASRLQRWEKQSRWSERSVEVFQREILIAFFCIRRLIESKKLTDKCANQNLRVTVYPWKGSRRVDRMNRHRIEELYRMERGSGSTLTLPFAANQMIHSFVLITVFSETGTLHGLLLSSDYRRNHRLVLIELKDLIRVIRSVCADDVTEIGEQRDPKTGDMERVYTR